jgi:hypothetical protein
MPVNHEEPVVLLNAVPALSLGLVVHCQINNRNGHPSYQIERSDGHCYDAGSHFKDRADYKALSLRKADQWKW